MLHKHHLIPKHAGGTDDSNLPKSEETKRKMSEARLRYWERKRYDKADQMSC